MPPKHGFFMNIICSVFTTPVKEYMTEHVTTTIVVVIARIIIVMIDSPIVEPINLPTFHRVCQYFTT